MNENAELLNYIYQNTQMGQESIEKMFDIVKDTTCLKLMQRQISEYQDINNKARLMLIESGTEEKSINTMAKISSTISIKFNTMIDKSRSHIADMMVQGSNMGIVEITKAMHRCENVEKEIKSLAEKLLKTEEANLEEWKKLL